MESINALSLTTDVNHWMASSRQPRVLHVFDCACNLINERRDILSIVTPQIGNGPFNLVIEAGILFSKYCNIASPISTHANQLILGDLLINTAHPNLWSPHPDWNRLHAHRERIVHHLMQLPIADYLKHSDFLNDRSESLNHGGFPIPQSLISNLSSALVKADISSAREITSRLAGLGIGLTPAGDDFILGAIYAAWMIHPSEMAAAFAEEIARTAAPLTASLSAAWLRSAGRGEVGILWHDFFNALISADAGRYQEGMDRIAAVGETSGYDALAGFLGTLVSYQEYMAAS